MALIAVGELLWDEGRREVARGEALVVHQRAQKVEVVPHAADVVPVKGGAHQTARVLARSTTLKTCAELVLQDRPALLRLLKQLGVSKLAERQTLANAFGRAVRSGWLVPPYTDYSGPSVAPPSSGAPATAAPSSIFRCEKCDGPHSSVLCPHFSQAREHHPDALSAATSGFAFAYQGRAFG